MGVPFDVLDVPDGLVEAAAGMVEGPDGDAARAWTRDLVESIVTGRAEAALLDVRNLYLVAVAARRKASGAEQKAARFASMLMALAQRNGGEVTIAQAEVEGLTGTLVEMSARDVEGTTLKIFQLDQGRRLQ